MSHRRQKRSRFSFAFENRKHITCCYTYEERNGNSSRWIGSLNFVKILHDTRWDFFFSDWASSDSLWSCCFLSLSGFGLVVCWWLEILHHDLFLRIIRSTRFMNLRIREHVLKKSNTLLGLLFSVVPSREIARGVVRLYDNSPFGLCGIESRHTTNDYRLRNLSRCSRIVLCSLQSSRV